MKRLLTYGLLLLTILASHFVVSACQDDLPETTDIMVTFTTRAISGGAASTAPEIEQMHDLRVIMLRSDGTIVDKGQYTPEGDFNPSSVRFTFSTTIPNPEGEDFTFLAIANEEYVDEELPWSTLGIGDKLTQSEIESITVDTDINTYPIPQTDYWTVHVPQSNYKIDDRTLQFAGSKISVVFNNMTKEEQSLSNIRITGITPNTQGYLFKQDGTDYIDSKDNNATPISWNEVLTLAAPTTGANDETIYASDSVAYYTYPLGEGNISSPMLYADWNGEQRELSLNRIKDKEGNEIDFTSLKRNEHLRIEITLTPAGDITVNYTIAAWEDTPTNIGGEAPTTPGNGYNTENWGASNDIEIGGDEDDPWSNLGGTIIAGGSDIFDNWLTLTGGGTNWLPIPLTGYLVSGYKIAIGFTIDNTSSDGIDFYFRTPWNNTISGPHSYSGEGEKIVTLLLDDTIISTITSQQTDKKDILMAVTFAKGSTQQASNITLTRMAIVNTN